MFLLPILLLQKSDIQDEIIANQTRLGKLGMPSTKADLAKFEPTSASISADKQFEMLGDSVREFATARFQKKPLPKLDWHKLTAGIDKLTGQPTSFFAIKIGDLMTFPKYSRGKLLAKELTAQAEADLKSGNKTRCLKLLKTAHALSTHSSWNQEFIGVLSARAAFAVYIASVKRVAASQRTWLVAHPELFRPLSQPNFRYIFDRDFVDTVVMVGKAFPVTKQTLPKNQTELRGLLCSLQNWQVLYPKIQKSKDWSDASKGYLEVEAKLKHVETGTKIEGEEEDAKFTMTADFLAGAQKLDEKLAQMNQELAEFGKR